MKVSAIENKPLLSKVLLKHWKSENSDLPSLDPSFDPKVKFKGHANVKIRMVI